MHKKFTLYSWYSILLFEKFATTKNEYIREAKI